MTHRSDVARARKIVERWCVLAEQRLDHLTELFESGRWRRYYSETTFLENIQEAKTAVESWRGLLTREGAPDNLAVDMSWLDCRKALPPRQETILRDEIRLPLPRSLQAAVDRTRPEPPEDLALEDTPPEQAEMASPADGNGWERGLDLSVIEQRYPLLRNAF